MAIKKTSVQPETFDGVSPTLRRWGLKAWFFLGIVLAIMSFVVFFSAIASLFVPFVIAVVMAMIFYPIVDFLEKYRVNRVLGSLFVMFLVVVVIILTGWLMWTGVYSYSDIIVAQIEAGLIALSGLITQVLPDEVAKRIIQNAMVAIPQVIGGISSIFFSSVSSIFALLMGIYFSFFLFYYLLSDWHNLSDWVGRRLGVGDKLGIEIANDASKAVRTYFYALTIANVPVAVTIGLVMSFMGLPLALPVAIVTLITCYIPYLGAIMSAVFAGLVALGSGGLWDAIVVIGVIIGMQNIVDPILVNYKASDELQMNPIVTLASTLVGGILFGALGAILGSPIAAVLIGVSNKLKGVSASEVSKNDSDGSQNVGDSDVQDEGG